MVRLEHDSGEAAVLKSAQILGPRSPLEFDSDGFAELDDEELASSVVGLHPHVELAVEPESSSEETSGDETCEVVMSSGDVCGRELPCGYHSNS